jgi:tellurite resistance protein TerC
LGLRSLYFLLAGVMGQFHYLKAGLAVILTFVGVKMLLPLLSRPFVGNLIEHELHIPNLASLGFIVATLLIAVIASLMRARRLAANPHPPTPSP